METQGIGRSKRQRSSDFYKKLFKLTIGGGVAFWAITIAFSLLPIAEEFRAAFSMDYIQSVLVEALHVFLIGATLNVPRFLFLGIVIGYLYKRLYGSA